MKGILYLIALSPLILKAEFIDANYLRDLPTPPREAKGQPYTWLDGSLSGVWSIGFGSFDNPNANFIEANWTPSYPLSRFGYLSRHFQVSDQRSILPGTSRFSQSAIIRWTANTNGIVDIKGEVLNLGDGDVDGRLRIYHQNNDALDLLWDTPYPSSNNSKTIQHTNLENISISKDDIIYFTISSGGQENAPIAFCPDNSLRILSTQEPDIGVRPEQNANALSLEYFKNRSKPEVLSVTNGRLPPLKKGRDLLEGRFQYGGQSGLVIDEKTSKVDWLSTGPSGDTQWTGALNRHLALASAVHYARTTDDGLDDRKAAEMLLDWIDSNPYPYNDEDISSHDPQDIPASPIPWYTLHAAIRLRSWAYLFDPLVQSGALSDVEFEQVRKSIREHMSLLRWRHRSSGNWKATEMHALALAALTWPELPESSDALKYAIREQYAEATLQVYPDGIQKELTPMYHFIVLNRLDEFKRMVEASGYVMPSTFSSLIQSMWEATAYMMRPDGNLPQANNSDSLQVDHEVLRAAKDANQDDWAWLGSGGELGERPKGLPSRFYPWAGILISRDTWPPQQKVWSAFDMGPWGMAHQHNDYGHLSIYAYGRPILIDSGRYTYNDNDPFHSYFKESASHNVLLIDGKGQNARPKLAEKPFGEETVTLDKQGDAAYAEFSYGYDTNTSIITCRQLYFNRSAGWWLIRDSWQEGEGVKTISVSWNFHPNCTVKTTKDTIETMDGGNGNIRIQLLENVSTNMSLFKGDRTSGGWYSEKYGHKVASSRVVSEWSGSNEGSVFWLITSGLETPPEAIASVKKEGASSTVRVELPNQTPVTVVFPKDKPPFVSSK